MYKRQTATGIITALIVNSLLVFSSSASAQSLLDEPQPQLRGVAQTSFLHAFAYLDGVRISKHCRRDSQFRCVHLTVTNGSDEPMVVDGDNAEGTDDKGNVVRVPTFDDVKHHTGCGLNAFDWTVLEVVAFGTVGFGKVLAEEWIEPHKDLGHAAGRDGWEHAVEVKRWGRIMITPGNTAEACLYFPRSQADHLQTVKLPVVSFTQSPTSGQLVVNVAAEAPPVLPGSMDAPSASDTPDAIQTTTQSEGFTTTQTTTKTQTPHTKATSVQTTIETPSTTETIIKTTIQSPTGTTTTTDTTTQPSDKVTAPLAAPQLP